jgi:hypothetical protein
VTSIDELIAVYAQEADFYPFCNGKEYSLAIIAALLKLPFTSRRAQ